MRVHGARSLRSVEPNMESVQNNTSNQSYYDRSENMCRVEPSSPAALESSASSARAQSSEPAPLPAGAAALVAAYRASGSGGAPSAPESLGTGGGAGIFEPPHEKSSLCTDRLIANGVICGAAGNLLAGRLGTDTIAGGLTSMALTTACTTLANWLEYNAPLGACGDD
jgi:hypothetical protein